MTNTSISDLISDFSSKLSLLIRRSALEQVLASLGGEAPAQKRRGRPLGSKNAKPKARRLRTADVAALREKLLAHIKANPGQRGEQIAKALKTDVGAMRPTMHKLIAEKLVRTEGQRRGMTYHPAGGAPKAARAAKPGKKKATRRRKVAKKMAAGKAKPASAKKAAVKRKGTKSKAEATPKVEASVPF